MTFGSTRRFPLSTQPTVGPIGISLADRFRIDALLGTGGMASVYRATDLFLGRTVAVKLFRLDTADDAGPERQSGEVTVLASLNHFALVTLFDAGTAVIDGVSRTFIVMELVDGTDLRSRIADGALNPDEVAFMGADLAEALHYVHARGIIHRDIKPANVLLAPSGFPGRAMHAKLADFGIARLFDSTRLTATGSLLGTAGYLSPEQALGSTIGPPSDVYSLGLVLLECLTGERAFTGTAIESAMARLQREPHIPAGLGEAWAAVLGGMTTREPTDRLSAGEAAVQLRRLSSGESTDAGTAVTVAMGAPAATELLEPTAVLGATEILEPTAVIGAAGALAPTEVLGADENLAPTAVLAAPGNLAPAAGLAPTKVMTAPHAGADAATEFLTPAGAPARSPGSAAERSPGSTRTDRTSTTAPPWRRPRVLVALGVLVALIILAVLVFTPRAVEPAAPAATYPAVDGSLGTNLKQLQESVTP
ncbi:serine/threonine-protein kinase [Cryobacterium sp. TMT3-29-2]|uniref:serine/threonine-protein kinase n=1 Tax=Cryobacterium sp. TMT3-29-2 TaxID=2555867 RepID=UPI001F541493|nr:serine/threonine-protein kinase [Cryobacterium sp. TMT3-29-2]